MWWVAVAVAAEPVTLEQIMADPDWIARSPERAGFSDDGRAVRFQQKRAGSPVRDWYEVDLRGGEPSLRTPDGSWAPPGGVLRRDGRARAVVHQGDVWLVERGKTRRLTATSGGEADPTFLADGRLAWRQGHDWSAVDGASIVPLVTVQSTDVPGAEPEGLAADQVRLFEALADEREEAAQRRAARAARQAPEVHVGSGRQVVLSALSADGRWLVLAHTPQETPKNERMPVFVQEDGYVGVEDIRPKVGTTGEADHALWLVDLRDGTHAVLDTSTLAGIEEDPLAELRETPLEGPRPVQLRRVVGSPDGERLALQLESADHKDRWLVEVVPASGPSLRPVHHEHDEAWVSWGLSTFDYSVGHQLWFTTEASGFNHLHVRDEDDVERVLTEGAWEVHDAVDDPAGRYVYFGANLSHPGNYELHRVSLATGEREQLTFLGGVNEGQLSPDGKNLLVRHSMTLDPPELYLQPLRKGAAAKRLTFTAEEAFLEGPWVEPEVIAIESDNGPIHARLYREGDTSGAPLVLFVHGAGYTQNAHLGWSYYFRETLFHTLLVQEGFVVLDLDYRASAGYGRDWRVAIYRQMGHPELEDLQTGVRWAVDELGVDADRVGLYGGSYGGFLTFMALFKQPEVWAAGAALRPVTDWAHYNDGYTRSILNTPELDPEAYRRSSPIEHAEGLADPLLFCHGMVDRNVAFQDSVRLAQRLIELEKTDWELAVYPVEGHGFTRPSSWLDEYRRVLGLFREHLAP